MQDDVNGFTNAASVATRMDMGRYEPMDGRRCDSRDGVGRVESHAVIGNQSSGLKSRPGNCSFTPVVLRSSA